MTQKEFDKLTKKQTKVDDLEAKLRASDNRLSSGELFLKSSYELQQKLSKLQNEIRKEMFDKQQNRP